MTFPIRTLCFCITFLSLTGTLLAQRGDGSLYSSYGIGLIANDNVGYSARLGGTGVAVRSPNFLNHVNPASSVGILRAYNFMVDADLKYQLMNISTSDENITINRTNFTHIAFWLKVSPSSAFTLGIMPISSVDNSFLETTYFVGSADPYSKLTKNYGDISKVYLNYALSIHPRLSVGIRPYYAFGHINDENSYEVQADVSGSVDSFRLNLRKNYNGAGMDLGLQFLAYTNRDKKLLMGLVYQAPAIINEKITESVRMVNTDSLLSETIDETQQMDFFQSAKFGISYQSNNWIVAADYVYKLFPSSWEDHVSAQQVSLGAEYVPSFYGMGFPQKFNYSAGLYYDTGNYLFQDKAVNRWGFTAGIGIPIQSLTRLSLSYQYEKQGNISLLSREITHGISLNINIADIWFQNRGFE